MYISTALSAATASILPAALLPSHDSLAHGSPVYAGTFQTNLERWSSLIGIITAIIGNILISFALNIQRYAHIRLEKERRSRKEKLRQPGQGSPGSYGTAQSSRNQNNGSRPVPHRSSLDSTSSTQSGGNDEDNRQETSYLSSPYWWGGIILMTVGEAGNFLAYGFAPASIVSPLGVVALISNCVIAPIMLKEQFRLRDFWGVVVAVGGAVTVVLSARQEEKKLGPHEILGAITTTGFEVYMGVTVAFIVMLMWASPRYGNKTILVDLGLVGLFGGYTALSTKGVASMLSSTLFRALTTPVTYALLLVLVGTAVMQVRYVNKALQRFDSTQVIPVQFVMFTISVIVGSAILYRDFETFTTENWVKFIGGCLLTFFGVWLITSGRPQHDDDDEEENLSDEEGEERINLVNQDPNAEEYFQDDSRRRESTGRYARSIADEAECSGDGATDSRRSSRVSFADPRPRSSGVRPNNRPSSPPRLTIEETEDTPLLNPWKASTDNLLRAPRHPGMMSANSSPMTFTQAQSPLPGDPTKPNALRSTSQANFHTHPNLQQSPAPPQADRPATPGRKLSRILPGPFISPISGSLSVVVADSLRRGFSSNNPNRRPRLGLRKTKSGSRRLQTADGIDEADRDSVSRGNDPQSADVSKSLGNDNTSWGRVTRARSLSTTLGDLFRAGKSKRDENADEEIGPDGSRQ